VELADALGVASSGADATLPTAAKDPFPWRRTRGPAAVGRGHRRARPAQGRRSVDAREAAVILQRGARPTCARGSTCRVAVPHGARRGRRCRHGGPGREQRPVYRRDGFAEAHDRWVGSSFTLTLNYEKPLGNNSAKGRLGARGRAPTRTIETGDLRRQVRLNVARTASALIETIGRLKQTQSASHTTRRSPRSWSASAPVRRR
jgi:hypothetical protein